MLALQGAQVQSLTGGLRSCIDVVSDSLWPHEPQHTRLPVLHNLSEFAQTHVHWVSDAIQPSHPLSSPSPLALNLSQHQDLFQWVVSLHQVAKVLQLQLQHQSFQWIFRILHATAKKKKRQKGGEQRWGKVCAGTGQGAHLQRKLRKDAELIVSLMISEISINPSERPLHTHQFPSQEQTSTADMSSYFRLPGLLPDQASGGRAKCVLGSFFIFFLIEV